jgi:hypothetical protein
LFKWLKLKKKSKNTRNKNTMTSTNQNQWNSWTAPSANYRPPVGPDTPSAWNWNNQPANPYTFGGFTQSFGGFTQPSTTPVAKTGQSVFNGGFHQSSNPPPMTFFSGFNQPPPAPSFTNQSAQVLPFGQRAPDPSGVGFANAPPQPAVNTQVSVKDDKTASFSLFSYKKPKFADLKLPKNKIEGLVFMVCLDKKNTVAYTNYMLSSCLSVSKYEPDSLWFLSLVELSDQTFLLNKIDEHNRPFAVLYSRLLRELMNETIQTPQELYSWLLKTARELTNDRMVLLFALLKFAKDQSLDDILNKSDCLEMFVLALQQFIKYDNNPIEVFKNALQDTKHDSLYKTFLLSLIGASYGKFTSNLIPSSTTLLELVERFANNKDTQGRSAPEFGGTSQ